MTSLVIWRLTPSDLWALCRRNTADGAYSVYRSGEWFGTFMNAADTVGRFYFWVTTPLCLYFTFFANPGPFLLIMPIIIITNLGLFFLFQIDIAGFNLIGFIFPRQRYEPHTENEIFIAQEYFVSGSFNHVSYLLRLQGAFHARLTDQRLILRFVSSWPGLCLICVPINMIERIEVIPLRRIFRMRGLKVHIQNHELVQFFLFESRHPDRWLRAFDRAGVVVERQRD